MDFVQIPKNARRVDSMKIAYALSLIFISGCSTIVSRTYTIEYRNPTNDTDDGILTEQIDGPITLYENVRYANGKVKIKTLMSMEPNQ